jgi:mannitol dehydrogenase-like protein
MKMALHFGAGKIGRGFIGELLHDSGYRIVFADLDARAVARINAEGQYTLFRIEHDYAEKIIDNVCACSAAADTEEIIRIIADAETEILSTSVMATNLSKAAPLIARGLKARLANRPRRKLVVMACENAIMGTNLLKEALLNTGMLTAEELDAAAVYPNTAVDRVVFDGEHHGKQGVEVGDAYELAVERAPFGAEEPPIRGAEYVDDLGKYLRRKIYIVNGAHAISAYCGYAAGYETVQDALRDETIQRIVRAAALEAAGALEKNDGFSHEELVAYMEKMVFQRYLTPGLADPVTRVGREPIRKLSANDRIMGPALQCEAQGLPNDHLLYGAACALHFDVAGDSEAEEIQAFIRTNGVARAIEKYTGVMEGTRIFGVIEAAYREVHGSD